MAYISIFCALLGFIFGRWTRGIEAKAHHQMFLNKLYDEINKLGKNKNEQEEKEEK